MKFESQLQIVTAAGVPPFTVNQTALVINLNADLLDGQHGSYYAAASSLGNYLPLTGGTLTGTLTGTVGIFTTLRATELTSLLGTNGPITITPDGTGHVHINSTDIRLGPNNTNATLATRGTGDLTLRTHEGSANEGFIRIFDGANGNIEIAPNGTGTVVVGKLSGSTASFSGQITSTVATGTAPLVIASTTAVTNLNADLLDGQHGSYYQNASNLNAGTLLAARLPAFTGGDVTSSAGSAVLTLATVATAGTYRSVTVDAKGRVTAGTNPTTLAGYAISDAMKIGGAPGVDLNTLTTSGVYRINNTEANRPNDWGQLLVMYGGSDTITQIYGHYVDGTLKTRSGNPTNVGGSGSWSPWRTLLADHNYSSYALPLTGGTITGQLSVNGSTASDILRLYTTGSTVWKLGVTDASGSYFNITADFGNFTINKSNGNVTTPGAFVSTVATGTAPLTVTSTTLVSNLNSQYLNGQLGSYYENRDTTAVGFSGGTLTLTRASGNLTTSLDGRYLLLSGGAITGNTTFSGDNHLTFGPNSTWSNSIRIGGNGYTATGTQMASVATTNGNLHLDSAKLAARGVYLNWYGGDAGTYFGNGSGGQSGRVDGSGNASFGGTVTSNYGTFSAPGHIIGDAQYGFYASAGSLFYKSASTGNHIWRNIANSADTMTLDNSGNLLLSGSLRLTDTTTGISKSGGRLSIRSESTDDVANFASYGLYLPKTGQTAGLYVESAIEARAGIRLGTSAANGTITVGADTANTANRLVQRDGSGNIAVSGIKQGADLARPLASWGVSGTSTGMVIFSFPGGGGNYGMVHCVFDIYEYNSNTVSTVIVGGHNWNGQWYNTGSNVIGRCGKTVRLGFKDGKYCVVFGGAASSWEYGTIVLRKIHNGAFYTGIMDMGGAFTTSQTATESFTWVTGDLRVLRSSAAIISDDYLRGTEVYSSNWFRNDNSGSGIYNSATSNHFYSDGPYWNVAYSGTQGIRFRNGHNGTILGYIYAETDGNFGLLSNNGGWAVQVKPGGGGNLNGTWTINSNTPLTSANYSGYALPLTGGTLTGALTINATGSVLGTAYNHSTYFGGTTAGSIRGSNEGYIVISSNSAGTSDKSIYLNSAASIQFDALSHYRFNKPSTAGYQTVALFGTAASGLFLTTDSPIISTGAYYNNGWIATAASGTLTNYVNGAYEWSTFSGATVGAAPALVSRMTLSNAGTLNVVGSITQNGNQVLHAGNVSTYALPISGGALTGTISIDTSGSTGSTSTVIIKRSGQSAINFGQYGGAWRSALQIQSNGNDRMLFFVPPETGYETGIFRVVNGGLSIDVGGTTSTTGVQAIAINSAGSVAIPVGLSVTATVNALNFSGPGTGLTGTASSLTAGAVAWTGVTGKPTTISGYGITDIVSSNVGSPVAADTTTKNGFYYVNSNISLFGQTDGALFVQAYDGTWASQIYQDYRTGQLAIRGRNSGTWQAWRTVLDSTNFLTAAPNSGVTAGTYNNVTVNIKGIVTGGSNVSYLTGNQSITLSGDLTGSGTTSIVATIAGDSITNAKLKTMAATTIKGNNTGVANAPADLTPAQVATMLSGQTMNINGSSASCTGNAATATNVAWSGITSKPTTFSGYGISDLVYGSTGSRNVWTITDWNQQTYPNAHFLSSEGNTTNAPSTDFIYGLQTSFHRSGSAYRTQMVTELYSSPVSMWVRNSRDSDVWTSWAKLVHSLNYTDYTVTKTGTGASGSWGINITGSSASCSGSAAQLNGQAASYYENRDITAVGFASGTLTLTRAAGNLSVSLDGRYLTGNQTISLTGAVTGSGTTSIATTLANSTVTYAKIQNVGVASVLGNSSASVSQAPQEITFGNLNNLLSGAAKAWVTFNENPTTGAITINASFNVSSITRINYGQYRVNFSTAFGDANYAISGTIGFESNGGYLYGGFLNVARSATPKTTTYCEVTASYGDGNTYNARYVHVVIDR
jgi:hypothetical protein